jgi:hypothetical protein
MIPLAKQDARSEQEHQTAVLEDTPLRFELPAVARTKRTVAFDGELMSSEAGGLLRGISGVWGGLHGRRRLRQLARCPRARPSCTSGVGTKPKRLSRFG